MEITKTRFNAGDQAPDWLLAVDPLGPRAVKGVVEFCVPCDVLEFDDHYMIFPAILGQVPQVMYATGEGCRIIAAGKPVHVAIGTLIVQGDVFGTFRTAKVFGNPPPKPVEVPSAEQLGGQRRFVIDPVHLYAAVGLIVILALLLFRR